MPYLTTTMLEQESTWFFTAWQPQIASSGAFDTWIGTVVTRVGNHTQWRVGAGLYGTGDPVVQGVLQEAELCLGQYYLCLASAAIADTSDDVTTVPMIAHGQNLRADAAVYLQRYNDILAPYDTPSAAPAGRSPLPWPARRSPRRCRSSSPRSIGRGRGNRSERHLNTNTPRGHPEDTKRTRREPQMDADKRGSMPTFGMPCPIRVHPRPSAVSSAGTSCLPGAL